MNPKSLLELLEECKSRGRIERVSIYSSISGRHITDMDIYDAEDRYGEMVAIKHQRHKTHIKVWIV